MNIRFGGAPYDNRRRKFVLDEKILTAPLRARKPKVYFVCDTMDMFHWAVPNSFINAMLSVMCEATEKNGHIFLVLTKRPNTMREHFIAPIKNVWLGVTAENQKAWNYRVDILTDIPADKRWVSIEPILEPIYIRDLAYHWFVSETAQCLMEPPRDTYICKGTRLDWIVVGAETGKGARPAQLDWFRNIRDACIDTDGFNIPLFIKQINAKRERVLDGKVWNRIPT
jgi:protein gp37